MPPGTPHSPGRMPPWLVRLCRLPQYKVQRIVFIGIDTYALPGAKIVKRFSRKFSVAGKFVHGEVHVAIGCRVCEAFFHENVNHGNHTIDMLRSPRLRGGCLHPKRRGIRFHRFDEPLRQYLDGLAVLVCAPNNFVVNIRYVAHIRNVKTARPQPALHHIENHQHSGMPEMAIIINGHAANVHFDLARLHRNKLLFFPGERIVDSEHVARL